MQNPKRIEGESMKLNMRKLRKEKGMTQTELGNCVSATTRQIGAWERGENELPLDYAYMIADALDCTIDELVNRPDFDYTHLKSDDERSLVGLYRALPNSGKKALLSGLLAYFSVE